MVYPFVAFLFYAVLERICRGYDWPREPYWIVRGIVWTALVIVGTEWMSQAVHQLLTPFSIFNLHHMGLWAIIPALLTYQLVIYAFHRALHGVPFLWRLHQMHHSSERLDVWSTYRTHPLEVLGYVLVGFVVYSGLLGVTQEASHYAGLILLVVGVFEHTNVRTPRWLGYIIARPENHMLHHGRTKHATNYADFPIIDMLFGTFENPETAPEKVGFWDGASRQLGPMLMGKDVVTAPKAVSTSTPT